MYEFVGQYILDRKCIFNEFYRPMTIFKGMLAILSYLLDLYSI